MFKSFTRLSAGVVCLLISSTVSADNFLYPVQSSVCLKKTGYKEDISYKLYDKAAFMAVKTSEYMQNKAQSLDDHNYNLLAYKIADKALDNISTAAKKEQGDYSCIKLIADIDGEKADKILQSMNIVALNTEKAEKIAQNIEKQIPEHSPTVSDGEMPLVYIKDIEFYNHTTSAAYTEKLSDELSLIPEIFITDDENLADYILIPRLLQSKNDKIDDKNSRYSMSVEIELQQASGTSIDKSQKNRYIIISDRAQTQEIAQKLLVKLLKECLNELSPRLKSLSN